VAESTLADYFGLPTGVSYNDLGVSALPFRAYNLIYNEWFRDQNLIDSVEVPTGDGPDNAAIFGSSAYPLNRGKRHDYFTSALPWPQKGDAVTLPLGTRADITTNTPNTPGAQLTMRNQGDGLHHTIETNGAAAEVGGSGLIANAIYADLTTATAATINDLREAFQIQKLYERDARGGTRYTEIVQSHFGVTSPDARLQRPEYLGGGSSRINVTPVAQTSSTDTTTPQGNLAAVGTVGINNHGFTKSFTEHGVVIGIACARADLTYQQGLNRMWSRQQRFDYYWPALAHLGEQTILNKEIYADGSANDDQVFGYQERFAEYRYKPSTITGKFRSNAAGTLDSWHLSQNFADLPVLGKTFIEENPPIDRIIATPDEPHFIFDAYFQLICARPMPVYSVPGLIDHF
jgi:hypothetical protein